MRSYEYVGPADLKRLISADRMGRAVGSLADFTAWAHSTPRSDLAAEPFTFVVDLSGCLRLAPRRSEHVVCAGGDCVLGAGEIGFERSDGGWTVAQISNRSTGYCPDPGCWSAVAAALDRIGLGRPSGFTQTVVFRRCPDCAELNVVREGFFVCVFCEGDLPAEWNLAAAEG